MKLIVKLSVWILKWIIVAKHLPRACLFKIREWVSRKQEKSIQQIEDECESITNREEPTPGKIVIASSVDEYLNNDEANPIILIGDKYRVRRIDNEEGARFFGANRGWCTADPKNNFYKICYSKEYGDLFIISRLNKNRPDYQLFVSKSGGIEFKAKFSKVNENWLSFKDADSKMKDWWDTYYFDFVSASRERIEIMSPSDDRTYPERASVFGGYGGGSLGGVAHGYGSIGQADSYLSGYGGGSQSGVNAEWRSVSIAQARMESQYEYDRSMRSLEAQAFNALSMESSRRQAQAHEQPFNERAREALLAHTQEWNVRLPSIRKGVLYEPPILFDGDP